MVFLNEGRFGCRFGGRSGLDDLGRFGSYFSRLNADRSGRGFHEMAVPVVRHVGRAAKRELGLLIRMLGFASGATGGVNIGARHDDDGVVGDASFAWTVVIHNIAETQRSLLHQFFTPNICECQGVRAFCTEVE